MHLKNCEMVYISMSDMDLPGKIAAGTWKNQSIHPVVPLLLVRPQYEQRTEAWYEVRKGLMTASDASGALGIPAFKSQRNPRQSLLEQKVSGSFTGNHMTRWGQDNEDQVRERAMQALGEVAWEVGLIIHPELEWLGASPDGVTSSGKLIEIKCPYKRVPEPQVVPHHYYPQIQVQLECTGLDSCYFIQWQPESLNGDKEIFCITTVERDRQWFQDHVASLKQFHSDLMQKRAEYIPPPDPVCQIDPSLYASVVVPDPSPARAPLRDLKRKLLDALDAIEVLEAQGVM